jgi:Farnesoic acid 0-methyl transferase
VVHTEAATPFSRVVLTTERQFFIFTVEACRDIHLFLTHLPGVVDHHGYDIIIGAADNAKSIIRKLPPEDDLVEFPSEGILACDSEVAIWVTWSGGVINVGRGNTVSSEVLFTWTDSSPYLINALSLASSDVERAVWTFLRESGKHFFEKYY